MPCVGHHLDPVSLYEPEVLRIHGGGVVRDLSPRQFDCSIKAARLPNSDTFLEDPGIGVRSDLGIKLEDGSDAEPARNRLSHGLTLHPGEPHCLPH
jgi:hypothetical protein